VRSMQEGSTGSTPERRWSPRCSALDARGIDRIYTLADEGRSGVEIAGEMGVSQTMVSRLLAKRPRPDAARLPLYGEAGEGGAGSDGEEASGEEASGEGADAAEPSEEDEGSAGPESDEHSPGKDEAVTKDDSQGQEAACERIGSGLVQSAYAGAMLLHGFFERAGASEVLAGLPSLSARRYDAPGLIGAASFGFALGSSSAEGTKHLLSADAGALIGRERFPHLRTLRPRLSALSEGVDPLVLQARLAKAMLEADETPPEVFFVDDHFVAYAGRARVQKGWNTRRRHAEAGRDDTFVVDHTWRAICFSSGPPSGLSKTMLDPLDQLRAIVGDRKVMIGFDRVGSYPKVFAELKARGFHFVTYRRAPLLEPAVAPRRTWTLIEGQRRYLSVADETVVMDGVGKVRQLSVFEDGKVALQILTSDMDSSAAFLARRLVGRWCIENTFKYLEDHHGIHWLCDYRMEVSPDTRAVANPERAKARARVRAAEAGVANLDRAIGTTATNPGENLAETNGELARLQNELPAARAELEAARAQLKTIPAKVPANELDLEATRAVSVLHRRALQMVCRLLAYNAELDLARSLNAYLEDENEYRAITRHLLHQPGTIAFEERAIGVTLRPPDAPRVATALGLLCDQLNAAPPRLLGDRRRITYRIAPRP